MRKGHTRVFKGKRVLVVMKSGNHFIAHFKESNDRRVKFTDHPPINCIDLRTLSIYKGKPGA